MVEAPERVIRAWIGRARSHVLAIRRAGGKRASREIGKWAALEGDLQALMVALAARDAEIAALRAELAAAEGDRDAEIMAREELNEVAGCDVAALWVECSDLRKHEAEAHEAVRKLLDANARLTAGIRDAVEGRYARVVLELDDDAPAEASEGLSLRMHLLGLIASEVGHD